MNYEKVRQAWDLPCASSVEKLVLAALCSYANGEDRCWPSIQSLRNRTHLSERSVQRSISDLKEKGLLILERPGGGKYKANFYRIILPNPATDTPYGIPRNGYRVSERTNGVPQAGNPATQTPNLKGTTKEELRGWKSPRKFVSELNAQIKIATEEMAQLKNKGSDGEGNWHDEQMLRDFKALAGKRKAWKAEIINQ